jgi:hypothetical protein
MKWGKGWEVGYNREIDAHQRAQMLAAEVPRQQPHRSPYCNCWHPRMHRELCPNCSSLR